jgi:hypothetical protein
VLHPTRERVREADGGARAPLLATLAPNEAPSMVFLAFMILEVKNIEQEVDLVFSNILMNVFDFNRSFVLDRMPVKCATIRRQDVFDFSIFVLTVAEAIRIKSKNHKNMQKLFF